MEYLGKSIRVDTNRRISRRELQNDGLEINREENGSIWRSWGLKSLSTPDQD